MTTVPLYHSPSIQSTSSVWFVVSDSKPNESTTVSVAAFAWPDCEPTIAASTSHSFGE